ncbi:MAG: large-conductance mechanosensitive channel protein MscL [Clostridia bacterium]|nr:large-conductance mechanosensitive channel protein MscL [Clostridia bacterium]
MKFFKEFKEFAMKGNVVDMAVGVIIGGAFGKIVTSLVNDIVMPAISLITGKVNVAEMAYVMGAKADGTEIALKYGAFLQNIIDFLIIAFSIFVVIKLMSKLHKKKVEEAPEAPAEPEPSAEEKLLTEIRDLLKEGK